MKEKRVVEWSHEQERALIEGVGKYGRGKWYSLQGYTLLSSEKSFKDAQAHTLPIHQEKDP